MRNFALKTTELFDAIKPDMLLLASIHFALTLYTDTKVFLVRDCSLYYLSKLLVLIFLIWFWQRVPDVIKELKNKKLSMYTVAAGIYFLINFVLLLLSWPGMWVSLDILGYYTGTLDFFPFFTDLFYAPALSCLPFLAGIIITEIFFASLVVGYTVSGFHKLYPSKYSLCLIIPFLLPIVLFYNSHPLIYPLYAYPVLFLFLGIIFKYLGKEEPRAKDMIVWGLLAVVAISARVEGIIFLPGIPIMIWVLFRKQLNFKKYYYLFLTVFLGCWVWTSLGPLAMINNFDYKVLAGYSPKLRKILETDFKTNDKAHDLEVIENVVPIDYLLGKIPPPETFMGATPAQKREFQITFFKLVIYNFPYLLKNSMKEYIDGQSFQVNFDKTTRLDIYSLETDNPVFQENRAFFKTKPLNNQLRLKIIGAVLFQKAEDLDEKLPGYYIFYNSYVPFIILLGFFTAGLLKKNPLFLTISGLLLCYAFEVFVFSCSLICMYFLLIYMCAYVFLAMFLLKLHYNKNKTE